VVVNRERNTLSVIEERFNPDVPEVEITTRISALKEKGYYPVRIHTDEAGKVVITFSIPKDGSIFGIHIG